MDDRRSHLKGKDEFRDKMLKPLFLSLFVTVRLILYHVESFNFGVTGICSLVLF